MIHTEIDHDMRERYHFQCHWEAVLNDGTTVYQSDVENKQSDQSDWFALKEHCQENNLKIVDLFFCFRKVRESVGANKDAYFFCKSVMGSLKSEENIFYYRLGYVENGIIKCRKYQVPGWMFIEDEEKNPKDYEDCIIG